MLMSMDRVHEECWSFTQRVMEYDLMDVDDVNRHIEIYTSLGTVTVTLDCDVLQEGLSIQVYNTMTKKLMHVIDDRDPLSIYSHLREGLLANLRSIEWKLNEGQRRSMLDLLTSTATPVTTTGYQEENPPWAPSRPKAVSRPDNS